MINTQCNTFRKDISNVINNSQLPPVVAYYILKDILRELDGICQEVLIQEDKQSKNSQQQEQVYLDIQNPEVKNILQQNKKVKEQLQKEEV